MLIRRPVKEIDLQVFRTLLSPQFKYYLPAGNSAPLSRDDELAMAKTLLAAMPDM